MKFVILVAVLVCAISAQYYNQQPNNMQMQQQQQPTTRYSTQYGQPNQYNQQYGYGSTTSNYNNRMYDPSTGTFRNGVSMTSALPAALTAAAVAYFL